MTKESTWLLEYKRDVYSQSGEDGIIEKILEVLPENDKWCVEFGAWDGLYLTNTRYLIEFKGFSSVLIESNENKFRNLRRNYAERDNVYTINRRVGFKEDDNLDHLLGDTPVPMDFDLLSIDIDGNDYHVWKAVSKYRPKVVVIEFNQTIPTHIRFVQPPDASVNQGSSLLSIAELGKEKGYELISVLPFNALFVKKEYYPLFDLENNFPQVLRTNMDDVTYLFAGYDGKVFLRGRCALPWHGFEFKASSFQPLPRYLRKYPPYYTVGQKIAFRLYLIITRPRQSINGFRKRIGRLLSFLIPSRFHRTGEKETGRNKEK
jgi:hypothetical protein